MRPITIVLLAACLSFSAIGSAQLPEETDEDLPRPRMVDPTPTPAPGFAAGVATPRILQWSDGRQLIVMAPQAWDVVAERGPRGSLGINISPRAGRVFSLVVDAIPLTPAEQVRMSGEGLRQLVESDGLRMLPRASERSIRLERVMGGSGQGYVYSITDSRAVLPSGEFRYRTAGAYLAGELLLVPSLLHNDTSGAVKTQMLEVLKSVRPLGDE